MALCTDLDGGIAGIFERCLINTLLNLAAAALEALKQVLLALLVPIDLAVAELIARLAQYDLLAQQLRLIRDAINGQIEALLERLNQLPLGLLDRECLAWAGINGSITNFLNGEIRPPLDQVLFELERLASFQSDLELLRNEYLAAKKLFTDVIDLLTTLILEAKCREAAGILPA
jgi:hypothetical protein